MKDRYKEWTRLGRSVKPTPKPAMVRMRDVSGIRALDDKILLYSDRKGKIDPYLQEELEELCRSIFGIADCDTLFIWPENACNLNENDHAYWEIMDLAIAHEKQFEIPLLDLDARVIKFLELGLDFRGTDGQPLRCLAHMMRSAEAAAKHLKGFATKLPTAEEIAIASFEERLTADAVAFAKVKRQR